MILFCRSNTPTQSASMSSSPVIRSSPCEHGRIARSARKYHTGEGTPASTQSCKAPYTSRPGINNHSLTIIHFRYRFNTTGKVLIPLLEPNIQPPKTTKFQLKCSLVPYSRITVSTISKINIKSNISYYETL